MREQKKLLLKPEVAMAYAKQLKAYCANQKDCKKCALHRPGRYPYASTCAIADTYEPPESWELDED